MWNTACPDWERRLMAGESLVPDLPLFKEEAERALRIFKRLRIPDMHGLPRMGASLKVKAADTDVITGGKQVGTMIDELHVLSAKANAADIMVELRGALAARPDGFLITVTTQSKKPPQGVFKAELEKARAVRDGQMKLPLLPILYELPHKLAVDGGWRDRKYWPIINSNLGRSVDEAFLERTVQEAEAEGSAQLALIASQHFNVQIGQGLTTDGWPGAEDWESCADPDLTLDRLLARSEVVTIGVDFGGKDDLFSLCVLGREPGAGILNRRRWSAGMRVAEIAALTLDDVLAPDGTIRAEIQLAPKQTKGSSDPGPRAVPMQSSDFDSGCYTDKNILHCR